MGSNADRYYEEIYRFERIQQCDIEVVLKKLKEITKILDCDNMGYIEDGIAILKRRYKEELL